MNVRDDNRRTPLHHAAEEGHGAVVRLLLDHNADANARDVNHKTPLHYAAAEGNQESAKILIDNRDLLTHRMPDSKEPLFIWLPAMVTKTLPDFLSKEEPSIPLHLAAESGKIRVIQFLIESGADARVFDEALMTPLRYFSLNGKQSEK